MARGFLARENAGAFTEVEPGGHFHDPVHAQLQTFVNEIRVARLDERPAKIEFPGAGQVIDPLAASSQLVVALALVNLVRIDRPGLQAGETDHDLEDRAGRVILLHRPIDLRPQLRIVQGFRFFHGQSRDEIVRIISRIGRHRDQVAVARVHHNHGAPRRPGVGHRGRTQSLFRRLLDVVVDGQKNILTGFGRTPGVLSLTIAEAVHQHRFDAGPAAQLLIQRALDAGGAFEIGQAITEENLFVVGRVIAQQITEQVGRRGAVRINPQRLNFQVEAGQMDRLFGEQGDLGRIEIGQDGHGNKEALIIVFEEVFVLQLDRLLKQGTDTINQIADHLVAGQFAQLGSLVAGEAGFGICPGDLAHDPVQVVAVG